MKIDIPVSQPYSVDIAPGLLDDLGQMCIRDSRFSDSPCESFVQRRARLSAPLQRIIGGLASFSAYSSFAQSRLLPTAFAQPLSLIHI